MYKYAYNLKIYNFEDISGGIIELPFYQLVIQLILAHNIFIKIIQF